MAVANAAGFFPTDQHLGFEHTVGDVLIANGCLMHRQAMHLGHLLHEVRAADGFDHLTVKPALCF